MFPSVSRTVQVSSPVPPAGKTSAEPSLIPVQVAGDGVMSNIYTKKQNKTYLLSNSYDQPIDEYDMFSDTYKKKIIFNRVDLEQPVKDNYQLYVISLENKQIIHNWSKYSSNLLNLIYNL